MLTPSRGVFAQRVKDEMVIVDSKTEMYLELNPTAASMWEIAIEVPDRASALARLAEQWSDVGTERLASGFDTFVADVVARGLATPG